MKEGNRMNQKACEGSWMTESPILTCLNQGRGVAKTHSQIVLFQGRAANSEYVWDGFKWKLMKLRQPISVGSIRALSECNSECSGYRSYRYGNVKCVSPNPSFWYAPIEYTVLSSKYRMAAICGGSTRRAFVDSKFCRGKCTICSPNGERPARRFNLTCSITLPQRG